MTYTVCIRTIVSLGKYTRGEHAHLVKKPTFAPAFLEESHSDIKAAADEALHLIHRLEPTGEKTCPCKLGLIGSLHEEFREWAARMYIKKNQKPYHTTTGVSICFDDAARAVKDGIPAAFIRDLGKDDMPRFEFFCPLDSATDHPTVQKMGYSAQVHDRHALLKKLAKKQTTAPKLDA